ncbi:MAG TPA: hypothetical protein VF699_05705, partial [Caulobacteraceae bacterium]
HLDIAGPCYTLSAGEMTAKINREKKNVRYLGFLPTPQLNAIRGDYDFSIVMWNPTDVNHFFASPNKFFETIAAEVPPVVAPHPQCADIVDRYGCGVLMGDWGHYAFEIALAQARAHFHGSQYENLVEGCREARAEWVNWPAQFQRVAEHLPARSTLVR